MPLTVSTATSHSISTSHHVGHDWLVLLVQGLPAITSLIVSSIALLTSYKQSQRTSQLTERQLEQGAAKLRLELFEERYQAWLRFDTIASRFTADIDDEDIPKLTGILTARRRLNFLYGEDVSSTALAITGQLVQLRRDEQRLRKHRSEERVMTDDVFRKVDDRKDNGVDAIDTARDKLEGAVKSYLRLEEIK